MNRSTLRLPRPLGAAGLFFAGMLLADASAAASGPPTPSRETTYFSAPLDAEGYVDYAAAINAALRDAAGGAVDPTQNALVGVLRHTSRRGWNAEHRRVLTALLGDPLEPAVPLPLLKLPDLVTEHGGTEAELDAEYDRMDTGERFTDGRMPRMAAYLDAMGPALDGIAAAAARPGYFAPIAKRPGDVAVNQALLPQLTWLRTAGRALELKGHRALGRGDLPVAVEAHTTLRRLAAHASAEPTYLGKLVALSIARLADDLLEAALGVDEITVTQLDALRNALATERQPVTAAIDRYGRAIAFDTLTQSSRRAGLFLELIRLQTELPAADLVWAAGVGRVLADPRFDLASALRRLGFLFDQVPVQEPGETLVALRERAERFDAALRKRKPTPKDERAVVAFDGASTSDAAFSRVSEAAVRMANGALVVGLHQLTRTEATAVAFGDLFAVALAAEAFRRDRRRYPATLDELTPVYLDAVPPDPADGGPLRYVPDGGGAGYLLYSVGPDGDDDGGVFGLPDGDLPVRVRTHRAAR